jgi:hypothetical protein
MSSMAAAYRRKALGKCVEAGYDSILRAISSPADKAHENGQGYDRTAADTADRSALTARRPA